MKCLLKLACYVPDPITGASHAKMSKKSSCPEAEARVVCERNNGRMEKKEGSFRFMFQAWTRKDL